MVKWKRMEISIIFPSSADPSPFVFERLVVHYAFVICLIVLDTFFLQERSFPVLFSPSCRCALQVLLSLSEDLPFLVTNERSG